MISLTQLFNVDSALAYYGQLAFLYGNRFLCQFVPRGGATTNVFDSSLGFLCKEMTLHSNKFDTGSVYVGGQNNPVLSKYVQDSVSLTLYNTGREYSTLSKYMSNVYNNNTCCYAYPSDTLFDIYVREYDRAGTEKQIHIFSGCIMTSFGGTQMSQDESDAIQTFDMDVEYWDYRNEAKNL